MCPSEVFALWRVLLLTDDFHGAIGLYIPLWSDVFFCKKKKIKKTFTRATGDLPSGSIILCTPNKPVVGGTFVPAVPCQWYRHADDVGDFTV